MPFDPIDSIFNLISKSPEKLRFLANFNVCQFSEVFCNSTGFSFVAMLLTRVQGIGVGVGGGVLVGGAAVGGMDVFVAVDMGTDVEVGGTGVGAGAHPFNMMIKKIATTRNTD